MNLADLVVSLFHHCPRRAVLGLVLMTAQAFLCNVIFLTYALVLGRLVAALMLPRVLRGTPPCPPRALRPARRRDL